MLVKFMDNALYPRRARLSVVIYPSNYLTGGTPPAGIEYVGQVSGEILDDSDWVFEQEFWSIVSRTIIYDQDFEVSKGLSN